MQTWVRLCGLALWVGSGLGTEKGDFVSKLFAYCIFEELKNSLLYPCARDEITYVLTTPAIVWGIIKYYNTIRKTDRDIGHMCG